MLGRLLVGGAGPVLAVRDVRLVVLTPEQVRAIVTEAVAEALRPPAAPRPKRRAPKRALSPADPEADRQLVEDLRRRGLA